MAINIPLSQILMISIPIALSAFTHLWNPIGFPSFYIDEGTYIKRAMLVLSGVGPQDASFNVYDHPYFGQLFLAGVLKLIGYPGSVVNLYGSSSVTSTGSNVHLSIEMLYVVPRVLMGILAVADTFLLYKISERRYNNRNIAFIAAVLFAVMPITWYTRRILLDSIQLPFLLSSILFALYYNSNNNNTAKSFSKTCSNNKEIITILLSGIFLGLAIFTKIPAFVFIPLVVFLLFNRAVDNSNRSRNIGLRRRLSLYRFRLDKRNMKMLGLWLIPVIFIPSIWPAFAAYIGEFSQWLNGVYFQSHRSSIRLSEHAQPLTLLDALKAFYKIDPILLILGTVGIGFSIAIKRDFMILFWSISFLILLYFIGFVLGFYLIPLLPVFCIATAIMINDLSNKVGKKRVQQKITTYFTNGYPWYKKFPLTRIIYNKYPRNIFLSFIIVSTIGIFGLISISALITTNFNSSFFKANAFVAEYISGNHSFRGNLTIISNGMFLLTPQYLLHTDHYYKEYYGTEPVKTQNIILILDEDDYNLWASRRNFGLMGQMQKIYESTFPKAVFKRDIDDIYNSSKYPQTSAEGNPVPSQIEIRTNVLRLNSSAHVIQTNNGTVAKIDNSLYRNIIAKQSESIRLYWNDPIKNCRHLFKCIVNSTAASKDNTYGKNNDTSFPITTNITAKHTLPSNSSNGVDISPGQKYQLMTQMKLNPYTTQSHDAIGTINFTSKSQKTGTTLQLSTNTTNKDTWSFIYGNEINVNPGEQYVFTTHMRLNEFVSGSHVVMEAYNDISKKWYQIMQCPSGTNGPLEWHEYSCNITIPKDVDKIRPVLNAGWSSQPGKQAVTLFDGIFLYKIRYLHRYDTIIFSPDLMQHIDPSARIANLCKLRGDFQIELKYKFVKMQEPDGAKLKLLVYCSRYNK